MLRIESMASLYIAVNIIIYVRNKKKTQNLMWDCVSRMSR